MHPRHDLAAALPYAARASGVDTVIVQGRVLVRGREHLTLDKAEIVAEASRRELASARGPKGGRTQTFPGGA